MFLSLHPLPAEVFLFHNCLFFSVHENDCIHNTGTLREREEHERESISVYESASTCNVIQNVTKILMNASLKRMCLKISLPLGVFWSSEWSLIIPWSSGDSSWNCGFDSCSSCWCMEAKELSNPVRNPTVPSSPFLSLKAAVEQFEDWAFKWHLPEQIASEVIAGLTALTNPARSLWNWGPRCSWILRCLSHLDG